MKKEKEARQLIANGQIIAAVKVIRDANGIGLKESKDLCEQWQSERSPKPPAAVSNNDTEIVAFRKVYEALESVAPDRREAIAKAALVLHGSITHD